MQVSLESTSDLERKLTVVIPEDQVKTKLQTKLQQLSKTVKMDGFRPGKVPYKVVEKRFGGAARDEIVGELLQTTLYEAITKEELKPAGMPTIDSVKNEQGQPLEYTAVFEIYPQIELIDMATVAVEQKTAEIAETDLSEMVDSIRKQHTEWKAVERAAAKEDKVNINFEGFLDGKQFEGGTAEKVDLVLGANQFIPGFEEGLIGACAGDNKELPLTFPESYHAKDLAGKAVVFKVTVNTVSEPELPELNEAFAKKMGVESGDLDTFKEEVKEQMQKQLKNKLRANLKQDVFQQLAEKHSFEVPKALVNSEIKNQLKQMMPNMKQELPDNMLDNAPDEMKNEATKRVKIGLIVGEIIKNNELKVDHDRVKDFIEEMASTYDHPEQVMSWYYGDKQRLASIEGVVLEDQVADFLAEKVSITPLPTSYSEIMNPQPPVEKETAETQK